MARPSGSSRETSSNRLLDPLRAALDRCDAQLLAWLKERMQIIRDVAELKRREGIPVMQSDRVDQVIRRVIAGLGGVGGSYLLTMARLGIGRFAIADFDTFDLPNFNCQAGAFVSTLGKAKADVMAGMVRDINPTIDVNVFSDGVTTNNLARFLCFRGA